MSTNKEVRLPPRFPKKWYEELSKKEEVKVVYAGDKDDN